MWYIGKKCSIFIYFQVWNPEIRMFFSVISNPNKGNGSAGIESRTKHSYRKEKEKRMSPLLHNCEQWFTRNSFSNKVYLFIWKHSIMKGAGSHFSDYMLYAKTDWSVINKMPFQGTIENAVVFYEVLWNKIDT